MTKGQLYFSNCLNSLAEKLYNNLFIKTTNPFEKRWIVVPNLSLKSYLMEIFATQFPFQIAFGVQVLSLFQVLSKVTGKSLPTALELSLILQDTLPSLIAHDPLLQTYFSKESLDRRIAPFCEELARSFLQYAIHGTPLLAPWQQTLWEAVEKMLFLPLSSSFCSEPLHLFGFTTLAKSFLTFFKQGTFYCFSPCEIFWADFYSSKEQLFLTKQLTNIAQDSFEKSFADQNPLLTNFGKVGRKFSIAVEDSPLQPQELFVTPSLTSCLKQLQLDLLQGTNSAPVFDDSLYFFSAPSKLRELEILKDHLFTLLDTQGIYPSDIQVLMQDPSAYAPYIHFVFADCNFTIFGQTLLDTSPTAQGMKKLLELVQNRFSVGSVLEFLFHKAVKTSATLTQPLVTRWLELANVLWGFSKEQRQLFYLQQFPKEHIANNPKSGTWLFGFSRLLLGLGHLEGEGAPLCCVAPTEMEQLNELYVQVTALAEDLSIMCDDTCWTIYTWLSYVEKLLSKYFILDASCPFLQELQKLKTTLEPFQEHTFPFSSIEQVFENLLQKKSAPPSVHNLQSIRFAPFTAGQLFPTKVICLLGLEQENVPRKEQASSFTCKPKDYCPTAAEEDRYLFLQALTFAKQFFIGSYIQKEEVKSSLLLSELLSYLTNGKIISHPLSPCDEQYFQNTSLTTYNKLHYELAKAAAVKPSALIQGFYEPISLKLPVVQEKTTLSLKNVCKFATHPLRYYLQEILGIYPPYPKDSKEFLLSPLVKGQLVKKGLLLGEEKMLLAAEKEGILPNNLCALLAKKQLLQEIQQWREAFRTFHIEWQAFTPLEVDLHIDAFHLVGTLETVTEKGIFLKGEKCIEDLIRFWPYLLLSQKLQLPLCFIKDLSSIAPSSYDFAPYLAYFVLGQQHPSPLTPELSKAFLQKEDIQSALQKTEDVHWKWLFLRDGKIEGDTMQNNWRPLLQNVFGALHDLL